MLTLLLLRARQLTIVPILGLMITSLALFIRGSRLIVQQFIVALLERPDQRNNFEIAILEGIDLLLMGTGCLALAIGMFSLFVRKLPLPDVLNFKNFHELKGMFANFIILTIAINFLQLFNDTPEVLSAAEGHGISLVYAGIGMILATFALLAFKYFGGDQNSGDNSTPHP
jgi:uncharacterized membrane protein YqhA